MATIRAGIPLPHGMTVGELIDELEQHPREATVSGGHSAPDPPYHSGSSYRIDLTYTTSGRKT